MILLFCVAITTPSSFSTDPSSQEKTYVLSSTLPDSQNFVTTFTTHTQANSQSLTLKARNLFGPLLIDSNKNRGQRAGPLIEIKAPYHNKERASDDLTGFLLQEGYMNEGYKIEILSMEEAAGKIRVINWKFSKSENEESPLIRYIKSLNLPKNIPIRIMSHINQADSEGLKDRMIKEQQLKEVEQAIASNTPFKKVFIDPLYTEPAACEMADYLKTIYPEMTIQEISDSSIKGFIAKLGNVELFYIADEIGVDGIAILKAEDYKVLKDDEATRFK